ncbi:MAG: 23S rRNA (guanosine(2251)-2'-O)-methyltransferase RlmB [Fuerstiella sp.]|nr:23S rRNA (guanosine(2251)-2'-O)-methyltransferase RlmB [Fuerstiella sp.]
MSDKRRSRRKQLDASHQRNWLIGRHAVTEVLKANVWPLRRLCSTSEFRAEMQEVLPSFAEHGLGEPIIEQVTAERLTQLCGSRHHQGVAVQMGPFPYLDLVSLARRLDERNESQSLSPLIVILDRIQDAHNLGAILRTCEAMAADAVIIGKAQQVGVTPQVARASAGAVSHIPVVRVDTLQNAVDLLRNAGMQILAASEKSPVSVWSVDTSLPTGLIIGSEAQGINQSLLKLCDRQISIPLCGRVGSLNAAVAAGMLLYELRRKKL